MMRTDAAKDSQQERPFAPAVICGAGPAGIATALWLWRLGVPFRLLERSIAVGGQVLRINLPIDDYPGVRCAHGRELASRLAEHLAAVGIQPELGVEVQALDARQRQLRTSKGDVPFDPLVIATGLAYRRLGVPGEEEYRGRGVSYSATTDLAFIAGQTVAVVGGGDGACENAAILATACPRVTLLVRGEAPRARPAMLARCQQASNVTIETNSQVLAIEGDGQHVTGLRILAPTGERQLAVDWVVIKIGFEAQTGFLAGQLALEPSGHVRVDRLLRTSLPGVFAAGDVANAHAPSIAAAVGDGAIAARSVLDYWLARHRGAGSPDR